LATGAVAAGYLLMTGSGLLPSLLLGSILGCTSVAIVIPFVNAMRLGKNTRTILTLDSAMGDAMAVLAVVVLIRYSLHPSSDFHRQLLATAGSILGGLLFGMLGGLLWVKVLERTAKMPLSYMVTLAAVFLLFSAAESVHVSGVIAVLFFGMALSNGPAILDRFPAMKGKTDWSASRSALDGTIRWFHEELTFIARVFFFVYLGMLLEWGSVSGRFLAVSAGLVSLIYLSRFASVLILGLTGRRLVPFERKILTTMGPRGLASAVLAMMPEAAGVPGTGIFVQYTFAVILVTNLLVTFAVLRSERRIDVMLAENPPPPPTIPDRVL
ncbi:MAG: cation:proton antiporter, partial [Deltaproteobacteria bacterium]|nr:cation:proton antiporter [Deltaproteobacteria bacterium]